MNFGGLFRAFAPRIIGGLASLVAGFIYNKTKGAVTLDPTQISVLAATMITSYGVAHTATAVVVNPAAAASPTLASEGVVVNKEVKSQNELNTKIVNSVGGK